MLEEIVESAKNQFVERLTSPLLGSFVVSWCLWNYKFIVILVSAASVSQTFKLVETHVFPTTWSVILYGIALPLVSACIYLFGYPYPARWVYRKVRGHARALDDIRKEYDGMELLSLEKSRKLRAEIAVADAAHKVEVDRLNEVIAELKAVQEKLAENQVGLNDEQRSKVTATQPDSMLPFPERVDDDLSEEMILVLRIFEVVNERLVEDQILQHSGLGSVSTKFALGELVNQGLLKHTPRRGSSAVYELTHEGRRQLLSMGREMNKIEFAPDSEK